VKHHLLKFAFLSGDGTTAGSGTANARVFPGSSRQDIVRGSVGNAPDASLDSPLNRRDLGVLAEDTMTVTIKDLEAFADGWNRHDVDFLMTFMTEDCVFETSAGPEASGKRYVGREQVRDGFAGVFRRFPDVHFGNARHFVSGARGLSEWLFTATAPDGKKIEVTGCDVFTFKGDKIAVKNSYLKNRTT
jgi:ketosteroid isomerase-like protein